MIGVQQARGRDTKAVTERKKARSSQGTDGFGCVPPWMTAELMKATQDRRTTGAFETTVSPRPHGDGAKPVDTDTVEGPARKGVSMLSNSSPWIGVQFPVLTSPCISFRRACRMVENNHEYTTYPE